MYHYQESSGKTDRYESLDHKTNNRPAKPSDQPGHPQSLIIVFVVCSEDKFARFKYIFEHRVDED